MLKMGKKPNFPPKDIHLDTRYTHIDVSHLGRHKKSIRWYGFTTHLVVLYEQQTPKKITNATEYMEKYYLLCNSCGNGSVPRLVLISGNCTD